jgi:hypothetical protein
LHSTCPNIFQPGFGANELAPQISMHFRTEVLKLLEKLFLAETAGISKLLLIFNGILIANSYALAETPHRKGELDVLAQKLGYSWKDCENASKGFSTFPFDENLNQKVACAPDTLYTWTEMKHIKNNLEAFGSIRISPQKFRHF